MLVVVLGQKQAKSVGMFLYKPDVLTQSLCVSSSEDPVQLQCLLLAGGDRRLRAGVQRNAASQSESPGPTSSLLSHTGNTGSCPVTLHVSSSLTGERRHGNLLVGGEEDSGLQERQP